MVRNLVASLCMFGVMSGQLLADSLGLTVAEFNGKIDGFGVVWALEITDVAEGSAAERADLRVGDIIIDVARFAPYRDGSGEQLQMRDLLAAAEGGDTYAIERVRPSDAQPGAVLADVVAQYDLGSFRLGNRPMRNGPLFSQIYTEDYRRALGRLRDDPDDIRGHRRRLNTLVVAYHTSFGRQCDPSAFGPVVKVTEQFTKTYDDSRMNDLYGYRGPEYVSYIRQAYYPQWVSSKSHLNTWNVVVAAEAMLQVGLDAEALIALNGCDAPELRTFEENLSQVTAMAN